jgi:hypothetical protein
MPDQGRQTPARSIGAILSIQRLGTIMLLTRLWTCVVMTMINYWFNLSMLAAESQRVIWLRTMKLALGGTAATTEAKRMVTEKMEAANQSAMRLMSGASPNSVVTDYRRKVRSNSRRLSK